VFSAFDDKDDPCWQDMEGSDVCGLLAMALVDIQNCGKIRTRYDICKTCFHGGEDAYCGLLGYDSVKSGVSVC
jgi:hypothetical protein